MRRVAALSLALTATSLVGQAAFGSVCATSGICIATDGDSAAGPTRPVENVQRTVEHAVAVRGGAVTNIVVGAANNAVDRGEKVAQGLGGISIGPLPPAPTPGVIPAPDALLRRVGRSLGDACQGLGGISIGPLPAPTPGIIPEDLFSQTAGPGSKLDQVAQGLGGIGIGPLPAPTPGIIPRPDAVLYGAATTCHGVASVVFDDGGSDVAAAGGQG